jgi:hypothetical protein
LQQELDYQQEFVQLSFHLLLQFQKECLQVLPHVLLLVQGLLVQVMNILCLALGQVQGLGQVLGQVLVQGLVQVQGLDLLQHRRLGLPNLLMVRFPYYTTPPNSLFFNIFCQA